MNRQVFFIVTAVVLAAASARPAEQGTEAPVPAGPAFQALQTLVGDWEASNAKGPVYSISFRLVSADSVLVQTYTTRSGRETLTLFHLDGPRLLATHYCAQGNQPRLRLAAVSGARYTFEFADATNLAEKASHLRRLDLELLDPDHARETETYVSDDKDDVTILSLSRRRR
jgi:hypothetical protein